MSNRKDIISFAKFIIRTECANSKSNDEIQKKITQYIDYLVENTDLEKDPITLNVLNRMADNIPSITHIINNLEYDDSFDKIVSSFVTEETAAQALDSDPNYGTKSDPYQRREYVAYPDFYAVGSCGKSISSCGSSTPVDRCGNPRTRSRC